MLTNVHFVPIYKHIMPCVVSCHRGPCQIQLGTANRLKNKQFTTEVAMHSGLNFWPLDCIECYLLCSMVQCHVCNLAISLTLEITRCLTSQKPA